MGNPKKTRGIIGQLYDIFKEFSLYSNTEEFFNKLLYTQNEADDNIHNYNTIKWSSLANYDYFDDYVFSDLNTLLSDETSFQNKIKLVVGNLSESQKIEFMAELIKLLDNLNSYSYSTKRIPNENNLKKYDSNSIKLLKSYFEVKQSYGDLSYNIYLLLYFSLHKHLPGNFFFGTKYKKDLAEFNEDVICKYGATSKPGVRAIIALAEREQPNIFALYEYADMLYYGSQNGPKQNLNKAFKTYKAAAGLNKIHNTLDSASACNPLALWSLAYIYINYRNVDSSDLGKCEQGTIPELDELSLIERIEGATHYASLSYNLIEDATAANILGRIASLHECDLPGITNIKEKYHLKTAQEYFKFASEHGYVYAINNFANIELEKIFSDPDNATSHAEQYIHYLDKSANEYEPWAANMLGRIYLDGKIQSKKNENNVIPYKQNKLKAKEYFELATKHFNDSNSAWAYANLLLNFPEDYIYNPKIFLEHNNRIDELGNVKARKMVNDKILMAYANYEDLLSLYQKTYNISIKDSKSK